MLDISPSHIYNMHLSVQFLPLVHCVSVDVFVPFVLISPA